MKDYIMKKTTKIIDGDKVTIIQGNCDNLEDDLAPEYDLKKNRFEAKSILGTVKEAK